MQYATVEKVKEGFEAASERMASSEKQTQLGFQEMKEAYTELAKQLRLYAHSVLNKSIRASGRTMHRPKCSASWC